MPNRVNPLPGTAQDPQDALTPPPAALLAQGQEDVQPGVSGEQGRGSQRQEASTSQSRDAVARPSTVSIWRECIRGCWDGFNCLRVEDDEPEPERPFNVELSMEAAHKTHYLSKFITRVQCFMMPTSISLKHHNPSDVKDIQKVLGICVRFRKHKCHQFCYHCRDCGVCPYRYTCSCWVYYKFRGTSWCAHIHVMHTLTNGTFKDEMCLYIQTDIRYMSMRHVRAFVVGDDFMIPTVEEGVYRVAANHFDPLRKYVVKQLKTEDECWCSPTNTCRKCDTCRCQYSCTCVDFQVDEMVCQHVHWMAMYHQRSLFVTGALKADFLYSLTASCDMNQKYYVELEHEMSFYIKSKNIKKQTGNPPDNLYLPSAVDIDEERLMNVENPDNISEVSIDSDATRRMVGEDSWWKIYRKYGKFDAQEEECRVVFRFIESMCISCAERKTPDYSRCPRCDICCHKYKCTCPLDANIICRHVHAVHRMWNNCQETENEAEEYIREHLPTPAFRAFLPVGYENEVDPFLGNFTPLGTERSDQRDILPPLTD